MWLTVRIWMAESAVWMVFAPMVGGSEHTLLGRSGRMRAAAVGYSG
jgi:hypothetical protein